MNTFASFLAHLLSTLMSLSTPSQIHDLFFSTVVTHIHHALMYAIQSAQSI